MKLIRFTSALAVISMMMLSGCQKDASISLTGGDVMLDLGQDFDEPGFSTEGISGEVLQLWNPAFDKHQVNHYVRTYTAEGVSAQRNVYVQSDLLSGLYHVEDNIEGVGIINYNVQVYQMEDSFNRMHIEGFADFVIVVDMEIEGEQIRIERQIPSGWTAEEFVEGTGTYDGESKSLVSFSYSIGYLWQGELVVESGNASYTKL